MSEAASSPTSAEKLSRIRLIAMDVDGVLTDGGILLDSNEGETKRFHVSDGLGIQLAILSGIIVVWISGRSSKAVERRVEELGVHHLYQNVADKSSALRSIMAEYRLAPENVAYIGDDLNDITAFSVAGVKFAPANAAVEMKALSDFITERAGGEGSVREVCDVILKAQGKWNDALTLYLERMMSPKA